MNLDFIAEGSQLCVDGELLGFRLIAWPLVFVEEGLPTGDEEEAVGQGGLTWHLQLDVLDPQVLEGEAADLDFDFGFKDEESHQVI